MDIALTVFGVFGVAGGLYGLWLAQTASDSHFDQNKHKLLTFGGRITWPGPKYYRRHSVLSSLVIIVVGVGMIIAGIV